MLNSFKRFDYLLFLSVALLAAFGFAALYSIGLGKEPQTFFYLQKQGTVFLFTLLIAIGIGFIDFRVIKSISLPLFILSLILLVLVLFFGTQVRGTRGWFFFGSYGFQVAELAKLSLILMIASYFSQYTKQLKSPRHIIISFCITAVPLCLVLLQPDFGSASVLFAIWLGMIAMSGIPKRYLALLSLLLLGIILSSWLFLFKEYQKQRIITFLSPAHDTLGSGYNVRQAMIAIGSGQLTGKGLGFGSQSQLKFLPETQTDFIFSVVAEELGMVGVFFMLLFWFLFFQRIFSIMRQTSDDFGLFLCIGVLFFFFTQVTLNIAGNTGMLPLTGQVLPFMSYGGSALAVSLLALGMVNSVKVHTSSFSRSS